MSRNWVKKTAAAVITVIVCFCCLFGCTTQTTAPAQTVQPTPTPEPMYNPAESEEYKLFGAWELYYSGSGLFSSMESEMSLPEEGYPLIACSATNTDKPYYSFAEVYEGWRGRTGYYSGFNPEVLGFALEDYPYVRLNFSTSAELSDITITVYKNDDFPEITLADSEEGENGLHTIIFNAAENAESGSLINPTFDCPGIFIEGFEVGDTFDICYVGFFKTEEDAENFEITDEEVIRYLNTDSAQDVNISELTDEIMQDIVEKNNARKEEIRNSPNLDLSQFTRGVYYISPDGDDNNMGTTPETAWRTTENLGKDISRFGVRTAVLFERGGVWKEGFDFVPGTTYSAYGEGEKPLFDASFDASDASIWQETEYQNIWAVDLSIIKDINDDIGNIVFNEGEAWGIKVLINTEDGKRTDYTVDSGIVFNGMETYESGSKPINSIAAMLTNNLEYYADIVADISEDKKLYVYFDKGNPAEYFDTIKISRGNFIFSRNAYSVTLDNLAFMHVGSHCIQTMECYDFTVQNCWFEWIGGSLQGDPTFNHTRYGNAIENWGKCDGLVIQNCYAGNVYDSAFTTQFSGETGDQTEYNMSNIDISNNVFEKCNSAVEIFNVAFSDVHEIVNATITNNYIMYSGHGLCSQRPVKDGNMFAGTRYRSNYYNGTSMIADNCVVFAILNKYTDACQWSSDMNPIIYQDNTYVIYTPKSMFATSEAIPECYQPTMLYPFSERILQMIQKKGYETGGTYYYTDKEYIEGVLEGAYYKTPPVLAE